MAFVLVLWGKVLFRFHILDVRRYGGERGCSASRERSAT